MNGSHFADIKMSNKMFSVCSESADTKYFKSALVLLNTYDYVLRFQQLVENLCSALNCMILQSMLD